ncbi:MAG: substrate-binding domain-containing protein [Mobilitalea sp.]
MKQMINRLLKSTRSQMLLMIALNLGLSLLLLVIRFISADVASVLLPVGLIIMMVSIGYLLFLFIRFFRSIDIIDESAVMLSQGNLNINDITSGKTKGLEVLTSAVDDMKRNLLSYIESTKSNVIILSDAVDKVTKSIDMSYKGNEQIVANMTSVAEKAQEQLKNAKESLEGIEAVSKGASKITTTLASLDSFVENTVKLTSDGTAHLGKYNEQMEVISTNLADTTSFIANLKSYLSDINQFGSLIINITEQLRLLSLNSQVEAARAGDAGRGFRVVAQEMNKLSDQTRDSVTQINKLLENVMKSNAKVSESLNNVNTSFNISKTIFASVNESFDIINKNANILNSDVKTVYEESRMISENTIGISRQSSILYDVSNEISSITEDVAAVTQEELAENEEISNQAQSLKKMLSSIEVLLKRYKTSVDPVAAASSRPLKIVMVSPSSNSFWEAVRQGAFYAQTELKGKNVDIELITFEKEDNEFVQNLLEKIDNSCDGLILPGFIKDAKQLVDRANTRNIPVMSYNCDFAEGIKRLSYFGPDIKKVGSLAGEMLARGIDEEGRVIIFKGDTTSSINQIRSEHAKKALSKFKDISIVAEVSDVTINGLVNKKLKEILYEQPNTNGIIIVGTGVPGAARAIEELHMVGKVKIFCFDYDDEIIELIRKGVVYKAMGQDPFGQGHDPIIYLYNYLVANQVPENVTYTRTEVIDIRSV